MDELSTATPAIAFEKKWKRLLQRVKKGEMPPEGEAPLPPEKLARLEKLVTEELASFDCEQVEVDPGRVTIRRLNRAEYRNTIRDLLAVDYEGVEDFPVDNSGYGFDNIGDVLSTSPLLLEKYLAAAEEISRAAVWVPESVSQPKVAIDIDQIEGGKRSGPHSVLTSNGDWVFRHRLNKDGLYLIVATAYADQGGSEPARMRFAVDRQQRKLVDVMATADQPEPYLAQVRLSAGEHHFALGFTNDYYVPKRADRNLWLADVEIVGPIDKEPGELPPAHRSLLSSVDENGLPRFDLKRLLLRAMRRPAKDEELQRLKDIIATVERRGGSRERGLRLALQAVLVSPHFLFRGEADEAPDDASRVHLVSEFELASRLSYFLWSSMPDDRLLELASSGQLRKNLTAEVRRMLASEKARALVENFAGQWLETRRVETVSPDPERFPSVDDKLRQAMREETEMFFAEVMREDRSIFEFLTGRFTYVNERLARHYDLPQEVIGDRMRRVDLDGQQRGGVLTHGSVLMITSLPTRTSPVKRGKWILEQILGQEPPDPPPNVPELEDEGRELTGTLRERLEQHRANASCASCHQRLDPLGFALENYDAVGRWRDREGGTPVDPSGVLPDGRSFAGPAELKQLLAGDRDAFRRALSEKMLTYALGRGLEYYDRCAVDQIVARLQRDGDRFSSLILAVVASDPFQKRRGDGGKP